jgi:hypothetical protein
VKSPIFVPVSPSELVSVTGGDGGNGTGKNNGELQWPEWTPPLDERGGEEAGKNIPGKRPPPNDQKDYPVPGQGQKGAPGLQFQPGGGITLWPGFNLKPW